MFKLRWFSSSSTHILAVVCLCQAPRTFAQFVWTGAGGNDSLQTALNWDGGTPPEDHYATPLVFGVDVRPSPVNSVPGYQFGSITILDTVTVPYTFTGQNVTLGYSLENSSTQLLTLAFNSINAINTATPVYVNLLKGDIEIACPNRFYLPEGRGLTVYGDNTAASRTLTLNTKLEGGPLEVRNKARVILARNNIYSSTTLYSSRLEIGDGGGSGNLGSGEVKIQGAGTLRFNRSGELTVQNRIYTTEQAPKIIGLDGPGVIRLEGGSDNTGIGAEVNAGTLVLAKESGSDVHALGASVIVKTGAKLQLAGTGYDQIENNSTVTLDGGTFDLGGMHEKIFRLEGSGVLDNSMADSNPELTCSAGQLTGTVQATGQNAKVRLYKPGGGILAFTGTAVWEVVIASGTFAAAASMSGLLTVAPAAQLAVGGIGSAGELSLTKTPDLKGETIFEISPGPGCDKLVVQGQPFQCGGKLTVLELSPLAGGEEFDLLDASSIQGQFSNVSLPDPGEGRNWWLEEMYVSGKIILNRKPVAGVIHCTRAPGLTLKFPIAEILAACTDLDRPLGDSLTLLSVVSATPELSTLTLTATHLFYEPAAGQQGGETLSYRVRDTRGAEATGEIQIAIEAPVSRIEGIRLVDGKPTLVLAGIPGYRYAVERSASTDFESFETVHTFTATGVVADWTDQTASGTVFYRMRWAAP